MNTIERNRFAVLLVALALAGLTGCSLPKAPKLFSLDSTWPWKDDEPKAEEPTRVVGMWTDTVLHKAGEKSQRGFGGRLIFYGKDANKPVMVDGELVVYAFDETGREQTDNKPTRRYVFPADQISRHESDSPIGPSYSFWLPWDEAGGPQTEVSLICRFQPKGGAVVVSEQTSHLLPGGLLPAGAVAGYTTPKLPEGVPSRPAFPQLSSQTRNVPAANGAQQASYEVAAGATPNALTGATTDVPTPARNMATTTIPLPADFQIPRGTISVPAAAFAPASRPNPAPAQQLAVPMNSQQAAPATAATNPAVTAVQNPNGRPQVGRPGTAYQPQARAIAPAVYNPTYAPVPNSQGILQPLQPMAPIGLNPPTMVPPQLAPQAAQPMPQQTSQPTSGSQPMTWPQTAQQPMQIPTSGTATVTYR